VTIPASWVRKGLSRRSRGATRAGWLSRRSRGVTRTKKLSCQSRGGRQSSVKNVYQS